MPAGRPSTYQEFIELENDTFYDKCIDLSQMVETGKLSSTGAKEVFSDMYDEHQQMLTGLKVFFTSIGEINE